MEEVLNSVKKKHRQKHRRKREQKKLAQLEADKTLATNGVSKSPTTRDSIKIDKKAKKDKKKPLQEKATLENDLNHSKTKHKNSKSPLKSSSNESILKHFSRTPKKNNEAVIVNECEENSPNKAIKKTNAFELLMNARNKTIGSNSPGKELSDVTEADAEKSTLKTKRKIFLQEWSDQKGATKRKLEEEYRTEYIEQEMENRAKRLKKMLVNGNKAKNSTPSTPTESPNISNENLSNKILKKKANKDKAIEKPKRARRKQKRLSSIESLETEETTNLDTDTIEFLSKLNSPTKKRDSLLGYFSKIESTKEIETKLEPDSRISPQEVTTPKTRQRRITKRVTTELNVKNSPEHKESTATPNSRPRRSCVNKMQQDIKLNCELLEKSKQDVHNSDDDEVEIINLDESSSAETPNQTPRKLAPVFMRYATKPSPNPEVLKARKEFLMSGLPEKLRLEWAKQKQQEQMVEETFEVFPKIAHVQQLNSHELSLLKSYKNFNFKLKPTLECEESPLSVHKKSKAKTRYSVGYLTKCTKEDFSTTEKRNNNVFQSVQLNVLPLINNKRQIIKMWKNDYSKFPTYKCYNQMREKYRYFNAIDSAQDTEQVTESFVVTRRTHRSNALTEFDSNSEYKPSSAAPNGELLFNEKYKPMLLEQVLVNSPPVVQLREFLANWSNGNGVGSLRSSQALDDSIDFANDSNSNQTNATNSVVLLGPISSGKTNAVFALANEMNFNVLEINAGMKRTGKKLIQELQEATQSHQIRKESSAGHGNSQQKLLKMSLKKQSSQNFDGDSSNGELSQNARKCLILIEDADVVFEQTDAGFTDAIYTLVASSKRPVVVIASNPNCQHLQRLMNQNTINFSAPNSLNISKYLSVLSLIENCPINLDDIISLYLYNHKDLRKTLHELQFFIQSGGDSQCATQQHDANKNASAPVQEKQYFASPEKRKFSQDTNTIYGNDEQLTNNVETACSDASDVVHMHRTLFQFYTIDQNERRRIPFPIDFDLLRFNINDILHVSNKLHTSTKSTARNNKTPKRKSRSPKKAWVKNLTQHDRNPMLELSQFYENISIATQLGNNNRKELFETDFVDRQVEHLSEIIAHNLAEKAIEINLDADMCPYNTFNIAKSGYTISNYLGTTVLRNQRALSLDVEPALRSICRSEKLRSSLERRSTRFYHYLRNCSVNMCNFSTQPFDIACDVLQECVTEVLDSDHKPET